MSAGRLCVREVDVACCDETVQAAAARMHARLVGTLVVVDDGRRPVGIVTDRDLAVRVVAAALDPVQTTVEQVMSVPPRTVGVDTPIEQALSLMRSGPFRRVPVVDADGRLEGLLSLDDVLDLLCEEFGTIRGLLARENPRSLAEV